MSNLRFTTLCSVLLAASTTRAQPTTSSPPAPPEAPATLPSEPPPQPTGSDAGAQLALPTPEPGESAVPIASAAEPPPSPASALVAKVTAATKPDLTLKPGGYLHVDGRRFVDDANAAHELTVRRLRFKLDGSISLVKFRTLIDFAGSRVSVLDAWAELAFRPELAIRAGKDKAQFGLERLQSATALTFIERAYPTQLAPNRDIGVWARGDVRGGVFHYAAGVVGGVANNAVLEAETDDVLEYNVHVLVSPFTGTLAKRYGDLSFGGASTFGRSKGTVTNPGLSALRTPGQLNFFQYASGMSPNATARTDGYRTRFTLHGTFYRGPVGVLAEYVRDREPVLLNGSRKLLENQAWQLAASLAVTPGDRPSYKGVKPKRAFDLAAGTWGAVELAARYSELRVDGDTFDLGMATGASSAARARSFTGGINWHLTEVVKLQADYELTTFEGGAMAGNRASEHLVATRIQASI